MQSDLSTHGLHLERPTIDSPVEGMVVTVIDGREYPLSHAEYWTDGVGYVVRSREFDCVVEGEDLDETMRAFGRAVYDYATGLQQRHDNGAATETDHQTLQLLADRLSRIYLAERRTQARRRGLLRRRVDRSERRSWRPMVPA